MTISSNYNAKIFAGDLLTWSAINSVAGALAGYTCSYNQSPQKACLAGLYTGPISLIFMKMIYTINQTSSQENKNPLLQKTCIVLLYGTCFLTMSAIVHSIYNSTSFTHALGFTALKEMFLAMEQLTIIKTRIIFNSINQRANPSEETPLISRDSEDPLKKLFEPKILCYEAIKMTALNAGAGVIIPCATMMITNDYTTPSKEIAELSLITGSTGIISMVFTKTTQTMTLSHEANSEVNSNSAPKILPRLVTVLGFFTASIVMHKIANYIQAISSGKPIDYEAILIFNTLKIAAVALETLLLQGITTICFSQIEHATQTHAIELVEDPV